MASPFSAHLRVIAIPQSYAEETLRYAEKFDVVKLFTAGPFDDDVIESPEEVREVCTEGMFIPGIQVTQL